MIARRTIFSAFLIFLVLTLSYCDEFDDISSSSSSSALSSSSSSSSASSALDEEKVPPIDEKAEKAKMTHWELLMTSGDLMGEKHFFVEITFLCLLAMCIWNYVYGKISNRMIAIRWISTHKQVFSDQFALISAASNEEPNPDELLSQKSFTEYKFFASGRKNCTALLAEITLLKRNDIFWRIIDALAYPYHDKVTLKIPLEESANAHPFLFFICRKGRQIAFREENEYFLEFTSQHRVEGLSSDLVAFTETSEIFDKLISAENLKLINDLSDYVELIAVTDLNNEAIEGIAGISSRVLTCTFRLPSPSIMGSILPLSELSLRLVDVVASLRLSTSGKNKVDRNRKAIADRAAKAQAELKQQLEREEIEKKKLEKLEKEKEVYDKLPKALKLKKDQKDEKRKKKEANKSMMTMKRK